mgnify:CR=1 FL=1
MHLSIFAMATTTNNHPHTWVQFVSYPRSGHHYLVNLLRSYWKFSGSQPHDNRTPFYCEKYNCCGQTPCAKGAVCGKSHDFLREELKWSASVPTILQVRHPAKSIESNFWLCVRKKSRESPLHATHDEIDPVRHMTNPRHTMR